MIKPTNMNTGKKPFSTREEKLAFLKGVQNKTRSLDEISDGSFGHLSYKNVNGGVVITGRDNKVLTREEAIKIRNHTGSNLMTYVSGKPDMPAYQMWHEDKPTNPKIGHHINWISQAGNAPIEGEED